ncbi:MAG: hypothetical protein FJY85_18055 [Deltaproteobacteria bacterium]|nr:hypothetical protein [Deltaproteobacteria bacterium]
MADRDTAALRKQIEDALKNEDLPRIYFNGFASGLGNADVFIVLHHQQRPVAILNASYTVAKTLAVKLGAAIASLEEISGNVIMTTDDIAKLMEEHSDAGE